MLNTAYNLSLDVDAVLRGQGADPAMIRARRPRLVEIAEKALAEGLPLLQPRALIQRFPIQAVRHNYLELAGGARLRGEAITQHLAAVQEVAAVVCTIGPALEEHLDQVMGVDMVRGLALYGVGSAAVEALANAVCRQLDAEAEQLGWQTTVPLSPGMIGWDVEQGQPQIFSLVDAAQIGVLLNERQIMLPQKSLSMLVGMGPNVQAKGSPCDYCAMAVVCRYRADAEIAGK